MKTTGAQKTFDEASYDRAMRLWGWTGYVTNIEAATMDAAEVVGSYHQLWHVEQSFRMSKTDLKARPIFHHTREAIEARLTVVFTALAVGRFLQQTTGVSLQRSSPPCGHYGSSPGGWANTNSPSHPTSRPRPLNSWRTYSPNTAERGTKVVELRAGPSSREACPRGGGSRFRRRTGSPRPKFSAVCPPVRTRSAAFSNNPSAVSVWAELACAITTSFPCRFSTTCTAVAPDPVRTLRTNATPLISQPQQKP